MTRLSRRVAVSLAAAILIAAVDSSVAAEVKASKELIVGTWNGKSEIDEAALKADERLKEVPADKVDLVLSFLKAEFGKLTLQITLKADGVALMETNSTVIAAKDRKQEGTWEVVKTDGPSITLKFTPKTVTEKDKPRDLVLTHVDEKTFTMDYPSLDGKKLPKGLKLRFTKQ